MDTVSVPLDYMAANQLLAACEQRLRTLRGHIDNGVADEALDIAILQTMRAEDALRKAFRLPTEAQLDWDQEAFQADMAELALRDGIASFPLALVEAESRALWGDR